MQQHIIMVQNGFCLQRAWILAEQRSKVNGKPRKLTNAKNKKRKKANGNGPFPERIHSPPRPHPFMSRMFLQKVFLILMFDFSA
jgi:hypothetical protein